MIDGIIRWSLQNRLFVLAAALGLIAWGAVETSRTPVDVFPDLTAPTVSIIAEAHGMAPEEVEVLLTLPIESALNGAAGVRRVRSKTSTGIAVINVDFEWGTDVHRARQFIAERLQLVRGSLPPEAEPPVMGPITSVMGDILFVGLTSDRHSPMELRTAGDWTVARRLLAAPGVAQVIVMGGDERQFQVLLDPRRLDAHEVTAEDVAHALEQSNENTSAGFLIESDQEQLIHGIGRVRTVDDVGMALVRLWKGTPLLVRDVADVVVGPALKRGDAGVNGGPGILIAVRKQPQANTLTLTRELETILDGIGAALPEGMIIHTGLFRQSDFIEVAVSNVGNALLEGAALVVLIVFFFLVSGRATAITAIAIPLSLLSAVLAMRIRGIEINTMTLGGMAIAVGALVDDAIIDVENVARRLRENARLDEPQSVLGVVFRASKEIRASIVFATLIIVVVFAPLYFLEGVEGRLLQPLGFAYVGSLFASLLVALTVTPVLCSLLLPGSRGVLKPHEAWIVIKLKGFYEPLLHSTVHHWKALTGLSAVLLAGAAIGTALAGRSFLPPFNEGALTISMVTLPGTSLEMSNRLGAMAEGIILNRPEVLSTGRRTGRASGDEHAQPVSSSEIDALLKPGLENKEEFLASLRAELATVPGTNVIIGQPLEHRIDHMLSGTRANIAVKIFGHDLSRLRELAEKVRQEMAAIDGVVDLSVEQQGELPLVTVRFRRRAIARYGLTIQQIAHEIETAFQGRTVGRVIDGPVGYDLVVRYDTRELDTLEAVREKHIGVPGGARLPLHVFADVERSLGPSLIARENVGRKIVVQCNVAERDLLSVVDDIRARVGENLIMPEGYRVEYGGQFESAQEASRIIGLVGAAVVMVVLVLLFVALGSMRDAWLVLLNLPLALIGGVVGVYASGGVISVASLIGFITLFGIATRNGIMMVTHFHHLRDEEGLSEPLEIVRRGALERLSPILMTALASGLGLLPLALSSGNPGSEIQAPMAMVILFGLVTSTALNMLVVPSLYLRFGAAAR